ncbi:Coatomer beta' subunit (COPB2) [Artemisia annua]|uniref:Coatomer beta' subunit (COPB2) n=1 Tax=Artemisia annua TaxID=35608 RepID=A0A2U1PBI9_ARTAN|nr:Coatomer beta' subunit (COPB2) [Artemisia annua]
MTILSNRIPEAALMARSYLPSKVSEIVALWTKDLYKVNQKVAESLADPEEYPDMFEEWQIALEVEGKAAETRSHFNLVETFKNNFEEPLENEELDHKDVEQNGEEYVDGSRGDSK